MKKSLHVSLALTLLVYLSYASFAAEDQIFIDDLTAPQLRAQIDKIQKEVYRVFNAANKNDQLDITCHDYLATGTSIKKEVCEPQFVIVRRTENAKSARHGTDPLLTPRQLQGELAGEFQDLTDAMKALAEESEYFEELNTILTVLNARLLEITN